jgi:acetate---CoA ligase (ADP-forming)
VIRVQSIEEMFVFASAFATQPIPKGKRVAVVTNSGGPGILATDACVQLGLEVPTLGEETQRRIRAVVAPEAAVANPVDMIASARGEHYEACLRAVMEDPQVDAVITIFTSLESIDSMKVAEGIMNGVAGFDKPVLVCFMGKVASKPAIQWMKSEGLPVYTFPEEAAHALHALVRYGHWVKRPAGESVSFEGFERGAIRTIFEKVRAGGRRTLTLAEAQHVLAHCGIPVSPWKEAASADEAASAASGLGFPVALKVSSAVLTHKSDVGGVRLGLRDADAVASAAREVLPKALEHDPAATLVVQCMAEGGIEVIFGASADPKFGPLMMFGLGGIFVEILKDVAFGVHPITDRDAWTMLESIKGAPILKGARGNEPVDLEALQETLLRLNQLLTEFPDIAEFDINPFFANPTREASVAVDARFTLN